MFDKSLQAELSKHPSLVSMTPKLVNQDPPEILFRSRLKGYYLCEKLCRIWVLETLRAARARGTFFVKWRNASNGETHDGTNVFAHFATMKYISLHQPGMSVQFDGNGAMKSTSVHFNKIRRYIWGYRSQLARCVSYPTTRFTTI